MKWILIETCEECPYLHWHLAVNKDTYHKPYCKLTLKDIEYTVRFHREIPDDCPLTDAY